MVASVVLVERNPRHGALPAFRRENEVDAIGSGNGPAQAAADAEPAFDNFLYGERHSGGARHDPPFDRAARLT